MRIPLGDFNRGALGSLVRLAEERCAPHLLRNLFGEELAALFVQPGRPAPAWSST
jgi:hypothetical protein